MTGVQGTRSGAALHYAETDAGGLARALSGRAGDAFLGLERGNMLFRARKWHEAAAEYESCLGMRPDYLEAQYNIVQVCAALGEGAKAVERALALLAGSPHSPALCLLLGAVLLRAGRLDEAEGSFLRALELDREFWPAHLGLSQIHFRRGPRALAKVRQALDSCLSAGPRSAAARIFRAETAALGAEYGTAALEYAGALEIDPSSAEAALGLAAALLEQGKESPASRLARSATRNAFSTPFERLTIPETLDIPPPLLEQAMRRARQLLALFPDAWESHVLAALVFEQKKSYDEALGLYRRARERWGGGASLLLRLGHLSRKLGKIQDAADWYGAYLEREPADQGARLLLGKCLLRLGRQQEAQRLLEEALSSGACDSETRLLLGGLYEKIGEHRKAEEQLAALLDEEPGHRRAKAALEAVRRSLGWREYFVRGLDLYSRGFADEAISMWNVGLSLEENAALHLYLGVACFSKGLVIDAFYAAERAARCETGKPAVVSDVKAMLQEAGAEIQKRIFFRTDSPRTEEVGDGLGGITDAVGRILYRLTALIDEQELVKGLDDGRLASSLGLAGSPPAALEEALVFDEHPEEASAPGPIPAMAEAAGQPLPSEEARLKAFGEWLERELDRKIEESRTVSCDSPEEEKVSVIARKIEQRQVAPPRSFLPGTDEVCEEAPPPIAPLPARRPWDWNQGLFWASVAGWYAAILLAVYCHVAAVGAYLLGFLALLALGAHLGRFAALEEWFDWKIGLLCGAVLGPTYIWWVVDFSAWDPVVALGSSIFLMFLLGGIMRNIVSPPAVQS